MMTLKVGPQPHKMVKHIQTILWGWRLKGYQITFRRLIADKTVAYKK